MCVVIDINAFSSVFSEDSVNHEEYRPLKEWIDRGGGFLVYGGTKYKNELSKIPRYLRLVRLMRDAGQAVAIRDEAVDELESDVVNKTRGTDCDDQHVIALLGASRCSILCSEDARSYPFVKNRTLYPHGMPRVKIYRSARNATILGKTRKNKLSNLE